MQVLAGGKLRGKSVYFLLCQAIPGIKKSAPGEIRTPDLLIRSQTLYPAELRAQNYCWLLVR